MGVVASGEVVLVLGDLGKAPPVRAPSMPPTGSRWKMPPRASAPLVTRRAPL